MRARDSVKQRRPLVRVPDVVLLLLLQMWPISLLWTMLAVKGAVAAAASGATARASATGWARRGGICVRMRMLLKMMLVMAVMMGMMTYGVHLLLLMVEVATASAGQVLLAVDASGQQHYRAVGPLLQGVVLHRDRIAVVVPEVLKDVTVQVHVLLADLLLLREDGFAFAQQPLLAVLHLLDLVGQRDDLVELALAAVLGSDLVLATPPDVPDERELRFAQVVLG